MLSLGKKPLPPFQGAMSGVGAYVVKKEVEQGGAIEAGEDEEALVSPPASDVRVGLLGDQAEHGEGL
ncbi:MAG: hypothetical protein IPK72_08710 [Candidatus Eisenbacteria bacterium]|nr:hypothetical protein [Candidatus Eisenbacteria bacterium]